MIERMSRTDLPPEQYYAQLARVRQGAGALITTRDGHVVMIATSYRDFYELPGGAVEGGEAPPLACARECREELGVEVDVGRLLVIDHQSDGGDPGDSTMFVYDGGSVALDALVQHSDDPEVRAIVVVDPAELDAVTIPRLADRIRRSLAARADGSVHEAVDGRTR